MYTLTYIDLSRTLYIQDVSPNISNSAFRKKLDTIGRVETCRINTGKMNSFVKVATREEAEKIKEHFQGYDIDGKSLKIAWACGYGPREDFNYTDGFTLYPINKIPPSHIEHIENTDRGGGKIIGGYVYEEPNLPLDLTLNARGSAIAPRKGLVMPPRIKKMLEREQGEIEEPTQKRLRHD
jgi:hypothetical protein